MHCLKRRPPNTTPVATLRAPILHHSPPCCVAWHIAAALQHGCGANSLHAQDDTVHGVPHSEETLALVVHEQIPNGTKDMAKHMRGLTLRVRVLHKLCEVMLRSGNPGKELAT